MKRRKTMDEYISRQYLLDEYDRQHQGPPGGARKIIAEAPAEDVAPVIHSEWEYHMSFGVCRKCGYEYNWTGTDAKNYCPNCGADMGGGTKWNKLIL